MKKYSAVLFDLFDTLVMFEPSLLPKVMLNGETWNSTAQHVFTRMRSSLGEMGFKDFYEPFVESHRELLELRKKDLREYPNRKRFEIFMEKMGLKEDDGMLEKFVFSHMEGLCGAMVYPEHHTEILLYLKEKGYRLSVVSNFDHAPTARELLRKFGIADFFEHIVISEEVGWRKPHRKIFEFALARFDESPSDVIFIGDDPEADIMGSSNCGIDSVWVKRREQFAQAKPKFIIKDLEDLKKII
ncbi:MAG: HAD family hydrolase [Candidatus Dadabacteria bacterium]|nr:HAD family hydrolase [Candidatus Dadabacteria bacterium]MDE0477529.1 HAD family hydrolase [Candidatus Dadabacteria bacterium]